MIRLQFNYHMGNDFLTELMKMRLL